MATRGALGGCSDPQWVRVASSGGSHGPEIFRTYPYPAYGVAGTISGAIQGDPERVPDPGDVYITLGGKGLTPDLGQVLTQDQVLTHLRLTNTSFSALT